MSLADVRGRKEIKIAIDSCQEILLQPTINNLSLSLSDKLPTILHVELIERKALRLLNTPEAIVRYPGFEAGERSKQFMAAGANGQFHVVKVSKESKVTCDCKGYR